MCSISFSLKSLLVALLIGLASFAINTSGFFTKQTPVVHTKQGPVRGIVGTSRDGRDYNAFVGIPFAESPTGKLRFEPPVPASSWNETFEANKYAPDCYQFDAMVKAQFLGSEDCLYLNVFTPKNTNATNLLPVMTWIHGGGFLSGGSKMYDPKYWMDFEVILVTINYRLGPFGFLNTGPLIRGNMGLKDQRLAFHWVQSNINSFGGNPENIVLFGESAGGASVHSHIISPSTKGLFHKAIIQSGSIASPWSLVRDPILQAKNYGKRVGCLNANMDQMVSCLRQKSARELVTPIMQFMEKAPFNGQDDIFAPSIEGTLAEDTFFKDDPRMLLKNGQFHNVPVMMGVTSAEGALRTARLEAIDADLDKIYKNWNEYCPILQSFDAYRINVSEQIKEYYFADKTFSEDREAFLRNFTVMASDGWFFQALHTTAILHLRKAPAYLYYYDYQAKSLPGIYSIIKAINVDDWLSPEIKIAISIAKDAFKKYFGYPGPHDYGSCHGDDLLQLFKLQWFLEIKTGSGDYKFSKNLVKSFVDFAKNENDLKFNGKNWPRMEPNKKNDPLQYMKLNQEGEVIDEPFLERLAFWDTLKIREWHDQAKK